MTRAIAIGLVIAGVVTALVGGRAISQWERAHGYPFGQMCQSVFTGWVNTCPVR